MAASESDEEAEIQPKKVDPKPAPNPPLGGSGGLFDDDEDDLFASVPAKKESLKKGMVQHRSITCSVCCMIFGLSREVFQAIMLLDI